MDGLQYNFGRGSAGLDRLGLNLKLFTASRSEIKVVLVALFGINADAVAAFLQSCFLGLSLQKSHENYLSCLCGNKSIQAYSFVCDDETGRMRRLDLDVESYLIKDNVIDIAGHGDFL